MLLYYRFKILIQKSSKKACDTKNDEKIDFSRMLETDVGDVLAKVNEPRNACVVSKLCSSLEYPHFLKRPIDTYIVAHRTGIIEARVSGFPKPEIKWYKNWHQITETPRIKVVETENNERMNILLNRGTRFRCIITNQALMS